LQSSSAHDAATRFEGPENLADARAYRSLTAGQFGVLLAYVAAGITYLSWRPTVFNADAVAFSTVFYAAELFGFLFALLHLFVCCRLSHRVAGDPPPGLSVGVFVESDRAPMETLERTLIAARDMDYPHATWLLDEGNCAEAEALAERLGVLYQARGSADSARGRALRRSRAAFIALFDAHDVPAPGFLSRTLDFFCDEAVAFVQTPRHLRAVDAIQRESAPGTRLVSHDLSWFFRVVQRGRDSWNAALFCGSCVVIRRAALDKVGGLGARAAADERRFSLRLHAHGLKSVYADEPLATSVSSDGVADYVEARARRGGSAHLACLLERRLTLSQRLCYLQLGMAPVEAWRKSLLWLVPLVALATGMLPIAAFDGRFLLYFLPYLVLHGWAFEEAGRGFARTLSTARLGLARVAGCLVLPWRREGQLARSLWTVAIANVVMAPTGLLLHGTSTSVLVLAAWAVANAGLAAATLAAVRKPDLPDVAPADFALPLPARLAFQDGAPVCGVIDHISPTGFRFHGRFPEYVRFGAEVEGELHLPGGPLPFSGSVRSFVLGRPGTEERFARSVGLSFDWVGAPRDEVLERVLAASSLRAGVTALVDGRPTPVERIGSVLRGSPLPSQPEDWAPVFLHRPAAPRDQAAVGLIALARQPGERLVLLTFGPVPEWSRIHLTVVHGATPLSLIGAVDHQRVVDTPIAPLYAYGFTGDRRVSATVRPRRAPAVTRRYARSAQR